MASYAPEFLIGYSLSVRPIISYSGLGARIEVLLLWTAGFFLGRFAYRGIGTISRYLGKSPFDAGNHVVVPLFKRSRINIFLADYYWSRLLFSDFVYEPEVARVLARHLDPGCVFLDLGANVGYWSIFASETITEPDHILAVEASRSTFDRLRGNAAINGNTFTTQQAAVTERTGESISFVTEKGHAAARITEAGEHFDSGQRIETVTTVSIDTLVERLKLEDTNRIVIKLDVEGAEVAALKGAAQTLRRENLLLIYEDHGSDPDCAVSRFVIEELGLAVYMVEDFGPARAVALADIAASKIDPLKGYNFVAVPRGTAVELAG